MEYFYFTVKINCLLKLIIQGNKLQTFIQNLKECSISSSDTLT